MPTDGTVQTLSDGTVITYDSDGHPIRQVTPDGSVFDRFTPDGRPLHGTVPGSDGQPAQSVDITYQGNASTWRYTDGTTVTYNNDGNVVRQQLPDGTVFDQFTADGKPTHGILAGNDGQPAQTVDITYQGNASTWRYADGTTVTYNDDGNVTRQQLPDGTVFDQFTPDGRPLHGTVPGSDGQPAQSVDITYQGDASTWRYTDGTTVTYNDDGNVVRQQLPDGTVFDQFTADGKPTHGILAGNDGQPAQAVDITYQGDASTWRYADGTTVTYNDDGNVTRQRLPDGTVFDQFTTDGKPTHGTIPPSDGQPAQTVDITYQGDTSSWRYADGTTVTYNDDGNVTHQQLPDGSVFDRFTADGRPTHGVLAGNDGQPAQAVDITYQGNASTWRYADGTTVTYNDDGNVTRQRLPDGTVFDQFTTDGKPTHGTIPPSDGQPAQTVDITYQGDTSSWRYADGTTVTYNNDGNVTHQQLPDGSVFDRFTADGRPTHGVLAGNDGQPAQAVDITYQGNASTWHYTDGTTVTYNDDGNVTRQQLPDGTVFDQFTPDGKPLHGVLAGSDGQPAQSVDITYQGDASTWHYADGTTVTYNDDGNVTRQQLPDGTVFDQFTPDGKPLHGVLAGSDGQPAQSVDITYQGDASTWHYTDGTTVTYNNDGNVTRQQLPDGTVFDQFTADGKPTHGILAGSDGQPAQSVDITYQGDASTWHYADGTTVTYNNDGNVTHQQLPDGSVFDRFTADGKPTHGTVPGSDGQPTQSVDITYQGDTSTWRYTDGTTVTYNTDGNVTHQQLPDGTVFDQFTPDGKPTHGVLAGSDGQPPQNAYITYNDNGSTWTFDDGTIVVHDTAGNVVQQTTPDGVVFDQFTADGRPTHGTIPPSDGQPAQTVDITYNDNGSTWTFDDGTIVVHDTAGNVVQQTTPDGVVFDQFTADGRPTHGTIPPSDGQPAQTVDITYNDNGSTWTFDDGTIVVHDTAGNVIRQQLPDGTVFDQFTADGRPTHGTIPPSDGQPAQTVDITYNDNGSTWTFDDGTIVVHDTAGNVIRQQLPDGTVFDQFTADGRPTHGTIPPSDDRPAQTVDITYDGDNSTWHYADGTTVVRNNAGDTVWQKLPDGTVYDQFTPDGKPTHGTIPPSDDRPAQTVDITYDGDNSTWHYADGTTVVRNNAGDTVWQKLPDGTVYDQFTPDGKPLHGTVPGKDGQPPQTVTVAYQADGSSTWTYHGPDGNTIVSRGANGAVVSQRLPDGTVYDRFTPDGKPLHGTVPPSDGQPGQTVTINYNSDGTSTWTYTDPSGKPTSAVTKDANGVPIIMVADGWTFDAFDAGRPTHGFKPGENGAGTETVDIRYNSGGSVWTYTDPDGDKTVITKDADGTTVKMEADGWTYTKFDADGRPTYGTKPGADGGPAETVQITYTSDGGSVWKYGDTTITRDADGNVVKLEADGWTYTKFDDQGRPTYGTKGDESVQISYHDGLIESTYSDGTVIVTDDNGRPLAQTVDGIAAEYRVEIPKLLAAKTTVATERDSISQTIGVMKSWFHAMNFYWNGPAADQYYAIYDEVTKIANNLETVLDEMVTALGQAYNRYLEAEGGNLNNLTPLSYEDGHWERTP